MKTYIKTLLFTLLLMSSITLKADTDVYSNSETEFSPADPNGDPGAPIDDYLLPMLGIGIFLGGYLSYKKAKDQLLKGGI
jgi:hypothetical protein